MLSARGVSLSEFRWRSGPRHRRERLRFAQARLFARQQHAQSAKRHADRQPNKVQVYTREI